MALSDTNQQAQAAASNPTPESLGHFSQSQNAGLNNQEATAGNSWDFGGGIDVGVMASPNSEIVGKIRDAVKENNLINDKGPADVRILFLDNGTEAFKTFQYSAIIIATSLRNNPSTVAYLPIALEKTGLRSELGVQSFDLGGGNFCNIPWASSETLDKQFYEACLGLVKDEIPNATSYMPVSGFTSGPRADLTEPQTLRSFLHAGATANMSILLSLTTAYDSLITVGNLEKNSQKFVGITVNGPTQAQDVRGLPLREDIRLELYSQVPQGQIKAAQAQSPFHSASSGKQTFSKLAGFMDYGFRPRNTNAYSGLSSDPYEATRALMGRFNITTIDLPSYNNFNSLILALASTAPMSSAQVWASTQYKRAQNYKEVLGDKDFDPTDIGVFGLLGGLIDQKSGQPQLVDTKTATFDAIQYAGLLNMTVAPNIAVGIDVARGDSKSWQWNIFTGIALKRLEAMKTLVSAANEATNGLFSPIFAANLSNHFKTNISPEMAGTAVEHFYIEYNNTLPDGYFESSIGKERQLRSLRNIDLLYVANKNPKDVATINRFAAAHIPGTAPYAKRMEDLLSLYSGFVQYTLTDYIDRHTFHPVLLQSLWESVRQAGLDPMVNFPGMLGVATQQNAYASYTAMGAAAQNPTFANQGGIVSGGSAYGTTNVVNNWVR